MAGYGLSSWALDILAATKLHEVIMSFRDHKVVPETNAICGSISPSVTRHSLPMRQDLNLPDQEDLSVMHPSFGCLLSFHLCQLRR